MNLLSEARFECATPCRLTVWAVGVLLGALAVAQQPDHPEENKPCLALKDIQYGAASVAKESRNACRRRCVEGSMRSCTLLGYLHGLAGDLEESQAVLRRSCDGGDLFGCLLFVNAQKANPHLSERRIHANDCDAGDPLACFHLGQIEHESGNVQRATDLTSTACDAGIVGACTLFGVISYEEGSPGGRSLLISEACTAGDADACDFERTVRERSQWETCASDLLTRHRTSCYPECLFPRDYRPLVATVTVECGTMDPVRRGDTPLLDQWTKAWADERRRSPFRAHPLPYRLPKPAD